jgi:UDP-GlcNAc:undecaprenyl-phosphate GlcNAc-1-phosphate transferase
MNPLLLVGSVLSGWLVVHLTVPLLERLCRRYQLLDLPSPRKIHRHATPRLTGISLFVALWGTILVFSLVVPGHMREMQSHAGTIMAGAVIILLMGILDDLWPLAAAWKLTGQLLVGMILWWEGVGFTQLWVPFVGGIGLGALSLPVTLLWFLVLVNAVNIIDGLDGLATATAGTALLPLIWVSFSLELTPIWVAAAGLFGALIAFWRYNHAPARVFMGDCGSLTLGYFFAVVALLAPIKRFTALAFFVPLIAMFLPVAESLFSLGRRSLARTNPMRADMGHLHHRLMTIGWTANQVVAAYAVVTAVFGLFCVAFRYGNRRILAVLLGFFVLLLMITLGIILRRRIPAQAARGKAGEGSGG